jgi:hypothetical protein
MAEADTSSGPWPLSRGRQGAGAVKTLPVVSEVRERAPAHYGSVTAFPFGTDDRSIMLRAAIAAVLT